MKGPYERLKYDLRRIWECPKCQARKRTDGTTTALICPCQLALVENERVSMNLLRDGIRRSRVKQPQASSTSSSESGQEHSDATATITQESTVTPSVEDVKTISSNDAAKEASEPTDTEATTETTENGSHTSASSDSSDEATGAD